jgi:hypothetical protein
MAKQKKVNGVPTPEEASGMSRMELLYRLREVTTTELREFRAQLEDMARLAGAFIRERMNLARRNERWEAAEVAHEEEARR